MNREAWLTLVAQRILDIYKESGFTSPKFRITCGWPSVKPLAVSRYRIGECHGPKSSRDGAYEIFITPLLGVKESLEIAGVVAHELVHAIVGIRAKHGNTFLRIGNALGLTCGKATSLSPGLALSGRLSEIIKELPPYPHSGMVCSKKPIKKNKPNNKETQNLPFECVGCGCRITVERDYAEEGHIPLCRCGQCFGPI